MCYHKKRKPSSRIMLYILSEWVHIVILFSGKWKVFVWLKMLAFWLASTGPFRTGNHQSLVNHKKYHSANHPYQCSLCTSSSKSIDNLVFHHINCVHLEELKVIYLVSNSDTTVIFTSDLPEWFSLIVDLSQKRIWCSQWLTKQRPFWNPLEKSNLRTVINIPKSQENRMIPQQLLQK